MATLVSGVQYGLSSEENFQEDIDYIFVKLTDSAYRAIQEYQKNQNKLGSTPKIQLQENGGHLSIPSAQSTATFSFSLSSNADIEGPQGSFECVRQREGQLTSLGALSRKMRIHANEDVYEATRHRMAAAVETQNNKCTRVIKPNQNDIGRKVKVKQIPGRLIPKREPPPMSAVPPKPPPVQINPNPVPTRISLINSNQQNTPSNHIANQNQPTSMHNGYHNVDNNKSSSYNQGQGRGGTGQQKPTGNPDIMRRPIKERLIHLLALRPFKKPELHARINSEGIKEREKNCISTVLMQISYMRDNTYNLNRNIWNDVQDDWPFYTEQEKAILKRRKPQNLTPPGSSDTGSSGSGQSPTSTHPGSPPPVISSSNKRSMLGDHEASESVPVRGPNPKKLRISHYQKPSEISYGGGNRVNENSNRRLVTDSRDTSNMNPRSREEFSSRNAMFETSGYNNNCEETEQQQADYRTINNTYNNKQPYSNHNNNNQHNSNGDSSLSFGLIRDKSAVNEMMNGMNIAAQLSPKNGFADTRTDSAMSVPERNCHDGNDSNWIKHADRRWNKVTSTTSNGNSTTPSVSPDSPGDRIAEDIAPDNPNSSQEICTEYDFQKHYTRIVNVDQRRHYKKEFDSYYEEYKNLHFAVNQVVQKFSDLEERLKNTDRNDPVHKEIKRMIVREYKNQMQDANHQENKKRFDYLHLKLSHIKKLVAEFDMELKATAYTKDY